MKIKISPLKFMHVSILVLCGATQLNISDVFFQISLNDDVYKFMTTLLLPVELCLLSKVTCSLVVWAYLALSTWPKQPEILKFEHMRSKYIIFRKTHPLLILNEFNSAYTLRFLQYKLT